MTQSPQSITELVTHLLEEPLKSLKFCYCFLQSQVLKGELYNMYFLPSFTTLLGETQQFHKTNKPWEFNTSCKVKCQRVL